MGRGDSKSRGAEGDAAGWHPNSRDWRKSKQTFGRAQSRPMLAQAKRRCKTRPFQAPFPCCVTWVVPAEAAGAGD